MKKIDGVQVNFRMPNGELLSKWYASLEDWLKEKCEIEFTAGQSLPEPEREMINIPAKKDMS